jgi:hypothetical protein
MSLTRERNFFVRVLRIRNSVCPRCDLHDYFRKFFDLPRPHSAGLGDDAMPWQRCTSRYVETTRPQLAGSSIFLRIVLIDISVESPGKARSGCSRAQWVGISFTSGWKSRAAYVVMVQATAADSSGARCKAGPADMQ